MKNSSDKAIPLALEVLAEEPRTPGMFLACVKYDIKKLRRVGVEDLTEMLFEKTLNLYPFAIINKKVMIFKAKHLAIIDVMLPLSPGMRITKVKEGE